MARVVIYDTTDLDREQIQSALAGTDHDVQFVEHSISDDNIDSEAEVIATFVTSIVTRQHMDSMPNLKLIACRSTGFNTVDVEAAQARDITVVNVPTYGENTVAEYAFTLLLALIRKLPQTLDSNNDTEQHELTGSDLSGKIFGVVGTGHIGRKAIAIARGFAMDVIAFDPFPNEEAAKELGYSYKSFDEVVALADIVSLHAPFTEQTHHIINSEALEKMKPSAILINTARGELIDTTALTRALSDDQIAGAALDVIEGEGILQHGEEMALLRADMLPTDVMLHSAEILTLSKMPNVIITPHNAFNSIEAIQRINGTTVQNIIDFYSGESPNKVKPMPKTMGKLYMVRHTESEWNATGQWTGTRDKHLSENGFREAAMVGHKIMNMGLKFDVVYCSEQVRTLETAEAILNATNQIDLPLRQNGAINERDYGDYTGMNKWQVKEEVGEEKWNAIRRGWDVHVPNGETLKDVHDRAVPFYLDEIIGLLKQGKNVLLVAHGNSLRALVKYIESIPDEQVAEVEMLFGDIVQYKLDDEGKLLEKDVTHVNFKPMHEKYHANALELSRNIS